jgi:hypothetical protein
MTWPFLPFYARSDGYCRWQTSFRPRRSPPIFSGPGGELMRFRVFTLAFDPATERFNDEAVREYLADKDVQPVADHFFMKDGTPYLVLVACYRLRLLAPPVEAEAKAG